MMDENRSVRKYSALALKGSNDSSALEALTGLLKDEHFSVRFAAFEGLQKKEDRAKPYLLKSISANNRSPVYAFDLMEDLLKKWGQKEN
jgi:HEAT repeat protein